MAKNYPISIPLWRLEGRVKTREKGVSANTQLTLLSAKCLAGHLSLAGPAEW